MVGRDSLHFYTGAAALKSTNNLLVLQNLKNVTLTRRCLLDALTYLHLFNPPENLKSATVLQKMNLVIFFCLIYSSIIL